MQKSPYPEDENSRKIIRIKNRLNAYRGQMSLRQAAREEIKNKSPYGEIAKEWFANKKRSRR